ncbi:MAG TPA: ECF-type sigma factor [Vicinamibacterales bacterium]|nr:ECF-type sigma factor [Vicinamibacterales bacterium]
MDSTISSLIAGADRGDPAAGDALFDALYAELHQLARRELARSGSHASLGVTTLLHEAYLDLAGRAGIGFPDRARFMGYAARVMPMKHPSRSSSGQRLRAAWPRVRCRDCRAELVQQSARTGGRNSGALIAPRGTVSWPLRLGMIVLS